MRIAVFISSHGFGHAARTAAVMEEAFELEPSLEFHIFTSAPGWLFRDSLSGPYTLHAEEVDPGPVQLDALRMDPEATAERFSAYLEGLPGRGREFGDRLRGLGIDGVLADISPLGVLAGAEAGLPTALLESFTWSQVLRTLSSEAPDSRESAESLARLSEDLTGLENLVELRIRADPAVSDPSVPVGDDWGGRAIRIPPVARAVRVAPEATRRAIGVPDGMPLVLLTLGGVGGEFPARALLEARPDTFFLVPRGSEWEFGSNVLRLPTRSGYFHPDLVAAADGVVGKLGYSTLAEAHQGRTRYGYFPRRGFTETGYLEGWLAGLGSGIRLPGEAARPDTWLYSLDSLLELQEPPAPEEADPGRLLGARALLLLMGGGAL
jgi:hypothetical protein